MTTLTISERTPTNIEVDLKKREVRIDWADGYHSLYSFDYLRKYCPCATCTEQRNNADPLRILKPDQVVTRAELDPVSPAERVGNYALQFFWQDGHRTGIYTFEFLRQNSP